MKKKKNENNISKYEKYSLRISIFAILFSIVNVILTSPLIFDYFTRGELNLSGIKTTRYDKVINHTFTVSNTGDKTLTNIEIEIHKLKGSKIQLLAETRDIKLDKPISLTKFNHDLILEKVYLTAKRLSGKDFFTVTIQRPRNIHQLYLNNINKLPIPYINNAFSDQGKAK